MGIAVAITKLRSLAKFEDKLNVVDDKVREDVVVEVVELQVVEDGVVEPVVNEGVRWNVVLGGVTVENDPLIIVAFIGRVLVTVETQGCARALLLVVDVGVAGNKGFEIELEVRVLTEVDDVGMFVALVVGSRDGDVLF